LEPRAWAVGLGVGEGGSVLGLLSKQRTVVVPHLDAGASAIVEPLRRAGVAAPNGRAPLETPREDADAGPVAEACRGVVHRIADAFRMSLWFYRSEYERESLPRYLLSGWLRVPRLNRWLTDELGLQS